jgi:CHAT domain-containing protein/tetratricopeptide (TPR) repeat protein
MLLSNELESTQEQMQLWKQHLHDPRFSGLDRAEICLEVGGLMAQEGDIISSKHHFQVAEQTFEELGCAEGKLRTQLQQLEAIRPKTLTEIRQMQQIAKDFEALGPPALQITALSLAVGEGADVLPWADMVDTFSHLERVLDQTSNRYAMLRLSVEFSAAAILRQEHLGKTFEYLQKSVDDASEETPKTTGQLFMQLGQAYRSLGDQDRSLKYVKMAVQMFEKWRLPDMLSDAKLALAMAMTSETPGPNHEAAIEILKESLRLDEERNDVQRQLKKLEAIVSLEGCLARSDQGDRHKELQDYWMGEWERIGERYHNDSIRQAELFMARGKFKSAEKLLRQRLVKCMDEKDLRRISKCQHLIFSSLFLSFGSSLHPEENYSQVRGVVDQAAAALAAYRELGPYSVPLEFILHISQAFQSLGENQEGQERNMLYAEALQYLEIGESISERLRRDLSSSSGLESLRQKQLLVASSTHDDIFNHALALTFALGDAEKMWRWTQRAKARALSDLVGSQLDSYTRQRPPKFAVDDQIVKLLEEEARLVRKLESAVSIDKVSTSMELERVRSMMEEHPRLGRLLASRAGKTDLQDLQWLFRNGEDRDISPDSKVVLVDWVIIGDNIVMVTLDARLEPQMSVLDMTLTHVRVWKQRYLSSHTSLVSSERLLEEGTLDKLNSLVSGLSQCTHEGDLLVFCPTRTLHAIPLHALKIEGVPVIWRNPVVYTASISLLRQCCERANSKLHERAGGLRTAFFSAYEDHSEDKMKITQREEAYKCIRKLASDFGSEPRLGCNANRENLMTVVKDVDILHFHGHTATHPNIIYQSLVLSDGKTSETSSGAQEFYHTQSSTSPYRPTLGPHKDAFTVRDAFSLNLNLSLASIVACSSGVQNYGTGDEPQGLLSALQYAGCATAIGTLWPVRSEDGRAFTLYFFQAVRRQGDTIASPWNLALSFQKAVRRLQKRKSTGLRLDHPYYWAAFVIHGAWYL